MYSEWSDYDIRYQTQPAGEAGVARCCKDQCTFQGSARADDSCMAAIGLMPAALSHGIGSESQRPLAIVIIGGLIGATFFALFVFPLIVEIVYGKMLYDKTVD